MYRHTHCTHHSYRSNCMYICQRCLSLHQRCIFCCLLFLSTKQYICQNAFKKPSRLHVFHLHISSSPNKGSYELGVADTADSLGCSLYWKMCSGKLIALNIGSAIIFAAEQILLYRFAARRLLTECGGRARLINKLSIIHTQHILENSLTLTDSRRCW